MFIDLTERGREGGQEGGERFGCDSRRELQAWLPLSFFWFCNVNFSRKCIILLTQPGSKWGHKRETIVTPFAGSKPTSGPLVPPRQREGCGGGERRPPGPSGPQDGSGLGFSGRTGACRRSPHFAFSLHGEATDLRSVPPPFKGKETFVSGETGSPAAPHLVRAFPGGLAFKPDPQVRGPTKEEVHTKHSNTHHEATECVPIPRVGK